MFVSKSSRGLRVETTMLRAAAWNTISASVTSFSTIAGSQTEPFTNSKPFRGRFSSRPVNRSSSTVTRAPSRMRRRTRLAPMKPAPPVTSTRAFSIGIMDGGAPKGWGSVAQAEAQVDERAQDAPAVLEAHLRGAPSMITDGHRSLLDAVARAHGLVEQIGFELVAVEPVLFEPDPGIVQERKPERPQPVRAVGDGMAARDAEQHRVDLGEPAAVGRDSRRGPAREPAGALDQVGFAGEEGHEDSGQLVRLVLVVAGEDGCELDPAAFGLEEPGA